MPGELNGFGVALAMGFLGSAHCMGMCGGFALLAGTGSGSRTRSLQHVGAYLLGKTMTYAALGAVLAGVVSGAAPTALPVQKIVGIATGVFLVAAGLHMAGLGPGWMLRAPAPASALVSRMSAAVRRSSLAGRWVLGLLNGLLPCGLLYAALAYSVSQPSAAAGAWFMTLFGLGTAPALAFMALGSAYLSAPGRVWLNRLLGWIVVAMGLGMLARATGLMQRLMSAM